MYGRFADGDRDRCPECFVPVGAPHMDSCEGTGTWTGVDDPPRRRGSREPDY
jgi:hypothetical protein